MQSQKVAFGSKIHVPKDRKERGEPATFDIDLKWKICRNVENKYQNFLYI